MTQSRQEAWEATEAAARLHARLFEWMLQHHERLAARPPPDPDQRLGRDCAGTCRLLP